MNTDIMTREQDIQKIIDYIIETPPDFYDNPNSGYEYTCPFCYARLVLKAIEKSPGMSDIKHDSKKCIWLIAEDLNTNMVCS